MEYVTEIKLRYLGPRQTSDGNGKWLKDDREFWRASFPDLGIQAIAPDPGEAVALLGVAISREGIELCEGEATEDNQELLKALELAMAQWRGWAAYGMGEEEQEEYDRIEEILSQYRE